MAAGIPRTSGFVADPVCTATGHFLEVEEDLTWPDRLAVLRWRRTYSSRFVAGRAVRPGLGVVGLGGAAPPGRRHRRLPRPRRPDGRVPRAAAGPGAGPTARVAGVEAVPPHRRRLGAPLGPPLRPARRRVGVRRRRATRDRRRPGVRHGHLRLRGRAAGGAHPRRRPPARPRLGHGRPARARIVAVWSSCGRVARYRYDDAGDLVGTERVLGDRLYVLDDGGRILEVWDADGVRLCRNTYDDEGRVVAQVSPFGRETTFAYHPGRRTMVADTTRGPCQHLRARRGRPARRPGRRRGPPARPPVRRGGPLPRGHRLRRRHHPPADRGRRPGGHPDRPRRGRRAVGVRRRPPGDRAHRRGRADHRARLRRRRPVPLAAVGPAGLGHAGRGGRRAAALAHRRRRGDRPVRPRRRWQRRGRHQRGRRHHPHRAPRQRRGRLAHPARRRRS